MFRLCMVVIWTQCWRTTWASAGRRPAPAWWLRWGCTSSSVFGGEWRTRRPQPWPTRQAKTPSPSYPRSSHPTSPSSRCQTRRNPPQSRQKARGVRRKENLKRRIEIHSRWKKKWEMAKNENTCSSDISHPLLDICCFTDITHNVHWGRLFF